MWGMNDIVEITYQKDYVYFIKFDDGLSGEIDFFEYFERGNIFASLKGLDFFKKAKIEGGTISWENGADVSPERLYEKIQVKKLEEVT